MNRPLVIIDYMDRISPGIEPLYKETYERAKHTYELLTEIAQKNNITILFKMQPTTADLEELRKIQAAQQKLQAENEAFDQFINTGTVTPIPPK